MAGLTMRRSLPERLRPAAPGDSDVVTWAPGRANLIGEYTDFNDGFVLPIALEACTWLLGRRIDGLLRLRSLDEPGEVSVNLTTGEGPRKGWGAYATGVVRAAIDGGLRLNGFDGVVGSDVPRGAGLSSSAALEVAIAFAILDEAVADSDLALMCQRAENVYVGMRCGIMDQLSSVAGLPGSALLIDCRSLAIRPLPFPDGLEVLLVDSGVRHSLTDGRYNDIRAACESAAAHLGVPALRDADETMLDAAALPDPDELRRARHVVTENRRTLEAADALARGDLAALGRLFAESHRSMATDLGISTPEIDTLVRIAAGTPGVVASRLTGGGFGGCTVTLVESALATDAAQSIVGAYRRETGIDARWWITRPSAGAGRGAGPPVTAATVAPTGTG